MINEQFENIRQWAEDRNLIEGSRPVNQISKLLEEMGELATGVNKNKIDLIADGIGDSIVVLTILAKQCDLNIEDCIDLAWNEIKDRKGRMVDGIFVKEADL
jgi:NTP pyrophosphatase (non-canonical NTP hydrolase)